MVNKNLCISCGTCLGICPVEAISWDSEGYAVIDSKCVKCKTCEGVCPTNAIKIKD